MIIDAHQHFWTYNQNDFGWITESCLRRDFAPSDLSREMTSAGVDAAITIEARQSLEETQQTLAFAAEHPFLAGVVGWLPLEENGAQLDDALNTFANNPFLVGCRHVVQDEPDPNFLLRENFLGGVKKALAAGLTYDILIFEHQLPVALRFIDQLPADARLVVDHFAKPTSYNLAWRLGMRELARRENVFIKASGLVTEVGVCDFRPYFDEILTAFGPSRVMFGSDWPVVSARLSYRAWVEQCRENLPEVCMGDIARNFYHLKERTK